MSLPKKSPKSKTLPSQLLQPLCTRRKSQSPRSPRTMQLSRCKRRQPSLLSLSKKHLHLQLMFKRLPHLHLLKLQRLPFRPFTRLHQLPIRLPHHKWQARWPSKCLHVWSDEPHAADDASAVANDDAATTAILPTAAAVHAPAVLPDDVRRLSPNAVGWYALIHATADATDASDAKHARAEDTGQDGCKWKQAHRPVVSAERR